MHTASSLGEWWKEKHKLWTKNYLEESNAMKCV